MTDAEHWIKENVPCLPASAKELAAMLTEYASQPTEALDKGEIEKLTKEYAKSYAGKHGQAIAAISFRDGFKSALSQSRKVPTHGEIKAILDKKQVFPKYGPPHHNELAQAWTFEDSVNKFREIIAKAIHNLITGKA